VNSFTYISHIHPFKCTFTQPNTDIVIGAADGTGFFVDDRFVNIYT